LAIQIILISISYLVGSIPASVWVGKWFFKLDIREHGSGNAGSTNAIRVLGARAGVPVLFFDIMKGFGVVQLAWLTDIDTGSDYFITFRLMLGVAAAIGHMLPVYVNFRGGKGVATFFGMLLAVVPLPTAIVLGVFMLTLLVSRYVSVSSMIAALAFPVFIILVFDYANLYLIGFSVIVFVLLVITHRKNIIRLVKGEESKVNFLSRNKRKS
jgi:glycerol-3-phosphate acyltransferase PlsY